MGLLNSLTTDPYLVFLPVGIAFLTQSRPEILNLEQLGRKTVSAFSPGCKFAMIFSPEAHWLGLEWQRQFWVLDVAEKTWGGLV